MSETSKLSTFPLIRLCEYNASHVILHSSNIWIFIYLLVFTFNGCITNSQALIWLDGSLGRALHWCRRGHGFESRSDLNFFQALISQLLISCVHDCDDWSILYLHIILRSPNTGVWIFIYRGYSHTYVTLSLMYCIVFVFL